MQSTAVPHTTRRVGASTKLIATLTAALLALGALLTGPVERGPARLARRGARQLHQPRQLDPPRARRRGRGHR